MHSRHLRPSGMDPISGEGNSRRPWRRGSGPWRGRRVRGSGAGAGAVQQGRVRGAGADGPPPSAHWWKSRGPTRSSRCGRSTGWWPPSAARSSTSSTRAASSRGSSRCSARRPTPRPRAGAPAHAPTRVLRPQGGGGRAARRGPRQAPPLPTAPQPRRVARQHGPLPTREARRHDTLSYPRDVRQ
jgi:hypothetical protein